MLGCQRAARQPPRTRLPPGERGYAVGSPKGDRQSAHRGHCGCWGCQGYGGHLTGGTGRQLQFASRGALPHQIKRKKVGDVWARHGAQLTRSDAESGRGRALNGVAGVCPNPHPPTLHRRERRGWGRRRRRCAPPAPWPRDLTGSMGQGVQPLVMFLLLGFATGRPPEHRGIGTTWQNRPSFGFRRALCIGAADWVTRSVEVRRETLVPPGLLG